MRGIARCARVNNKYAKGKHLRRVRARAHPAPPLGKINFPYVKYRHTGAPGVFAMERRTLRAGRGANCNYTRLARDADKEPQLRRFARGLSCSGLISMLPCKFITKVALVSIAPRFPFTLLARPHCFPKT